GRSRTTPSLSSKPSAEDSPSGNLVTAARSSSAAALRMAANASITVPAPKRSHSSLTRCAPICVTAICAWISPRISAGCRLRVIGNEDVAGLYCSLAAIELEDTAHEVAIDRRMEKHRRRHDQAPLAVQNHAAEISGFADDRRVAGAIEVVMHFIDQARDLVA